MKTLKNSIDTKILEARNKERVKDKNDPRGMYFRDATAIIHSTPFRRLKKKTQVFFAPSNDHICTRLEHVLHVATIAVSICKGLHLNSDLAWAIGLGHDLGHTPFGHLGESILNDFSTHSFCHELHSLRVVDTLYALNLCYAVRDGIVSHCGEKFEQKINPTHKANDIAAYTDRSHYPATYEGCIVRMADKIAYLGRDYEDAIKLGIIPPNTLPVNVTRIFDHENNSNIINTFAKDLIQYTRQTGEVGFSDEVFEALISFKEFNYTHIYKSDYILEQQEKVTHLLKVILAFLIEEVTKNTSNESAYLNSKLHIIKGLGNHLIKYGNLYNLDNTEEQKIFIIDYVASMTDDYVIKTSKEVLYPLT